MELFSIRLILCMLAIGYNTVTHGQVYTATFDVTKYGALGNGRTDDSKAFLATWNAACRQVTDAKVIVPEGKIYLLNPISFKGPCKCHSITVEILGEIIATVDKKAWKGVDGDSWLAFRHVDRLTVKGNGQGQINGKGSAWWKFGASYNKGPTALRFSSCQNITLDGLNHIDSQKNHISITKCNGANITNLNISAHPRSPNTDGIDISGSTNLMIHNLNISTGDDCVAINGGCSNINITKVACGPGHGISIGSLGKAGKRDEVGDIHIGDCSFNQTVNGVRIKTWQGGSGYARNISFTGITFYGANNPIIIDQYYCPHKVCKNQTSAVAVSNVTYSGIRGTSIKPEAISLNCSQTVPCTDIVLEDINITYANGNTTGNAYAHCINAHGVARLVTHELNCLTRLKKMEAISPESSDKSKLN